MRTIIAGTALLLAACTPAPTNVAEDTNAAVVAADDTGTPANDAAAVPGNAATPAPTPTADGNAGFTSQFTSGGVRRCRTIEQNIEEGGYVRHRCDGVGGYTYEIVESDLRQNLIILAPGGERHQLDLIRIGGGGFSNLGGTLEWRGPTGQPPRTLTARFNVAQGEDVPDQSNLLVVKLAPPSCVVAVVPPGPDQSAKSRAVADAPSLPACRY